MLDVVESALRGRFGLSRRDGGQNALKRAIVDIGHAMNTTEEILLKRAPFDPVLLKEIAGRITVPESYFFRQVDQLELIAQHVEQKLRHGMVGGKITIWSAGCSQGEEPLSLAMLLKERLAESELGFIAIRATDLSRTAIATAREGIYSPWSFRATDDLRKRRFFEPVDDNRFRLSQEIRSLVEFEHSSIQEQLSITAPDSYDIVLFRNVAIYLEESCLSVLYDTIAGALRPAGWLCLSPSDPMVSSPAYQRLDTVSPIFRRRNAWDSTLGRIRPTPSDNEPTPRRSPSAKRGDPRNAAVSPRPARVVDTKPEAEERLREGLSLVEQGRLPEARIVAEWLLNRHPDASFSNYLNGRVFLASENMVDAESCFRKAVFADPVGPLPRFWYAVTLLERDAVRRARAQLSRLISDLDSADRDQLLVDGKTNVKTLLGAARTLIESMEQ